MRKTKLLSLLLALLMILSAFAAFPITAAAADAWDGETITAPEGEGTKAKPFLIASAENLAWVSHMTKNYQELNTAIGTSYASYDVFEGKYFVQTADIDLGGKTFTPIGFTQATENSKRNAFAGNYDGRNYKISNAVINPETSVKRTEYGEFMASGYHPGGLFGVLAAGASVANVNASKIVVGEIKSNATLRNRIYTLTAAGVIVGATNGSATITGCTTDADCVVYGFYAAGGILGLPEIGAYVINCENKAKVSSCVASGGIVGMGYNTDVSYCINRGKVEHYTTDRWSSGGGIMGTMLNVGANTSNSIAYCINDGEVSAISFQSAGGTNRVALGGMIGHDGLAANSDIKYTYCYNLQKHFNIKFLDNGNTGANYLALVGAVAGNTRDSAGAKGIRTFEYCYGVASDKNYDWTAISADSIIGGNGQSQTEKTKVYALDWNEQGAGGGALCPEKFAGIVGSEITVQQITNGIGNPNDVFATCEYGVAEDTLKAHPEYQAIVSMVAENEAFANAPKYVGVQETLDKSAGKYALRFVLATTRTDYHRAGVEIVASYGEGQMQTFTLTADKYHNSLSGKVDGKGVNYTAESFGGTKLMALKLELDLATYGAVSYAVTPFFVEEAGGEANYGRTWTVNYDADGFFAGQSIVEAIVEDDDTAKYTIVYPDTSVMAPEYTVVALQYHILSKRGIKMPLSNERSADEDAFEIVIEEDNTLEQGAYTTTVEGNRLIVKAKDTFGFIAAANRLVRQIFANGRIKMTNTCNTQGVYDREMLTERAGTTRVIFQNVWLRTSSANGAEFTSTITSYQYQLALVALYQPDVIGFNEFWAGWRSCGFIEAMAEIGYVEAQPIVNGQPITDLGDALFYNTETTELVENSARYLSYGVYTTVDTDYDGVNEAVRRNTGEFKGRYYDNSDYRWLCATVGTFRGKLTGDEYSACVTHLESNGPVDPQIAPLGNPLRMEQVEKLIPFLKAYQAEFGKIILVGGDYNSADSYAPGKYSAKGDDKPWEFDWDSEYEWHDGTMKKQLWGACDELRANGFINCREDTRNTAHNHSCNGYPTWNNDLKAYVGYSASLTDSSEKSAYAGSIDHIYALETFEGELDTQVYRNLSVETILSSSDHKPVMIDFNLGVDDGTGDDPSTAEPWQGMDDYAEPDKGFGTQDNPFLIENAQHLAWLSRMVEDATAASAFSGRTEEARKVFAGLYFKQTADIDLNNQEFMPIGSYMGATSANRHLFGGIYDGNGFKIMNAKVSMADHVGKDYYKNTEAASFAPPANPGAEGAAGHYDALFNVSAGVVLQNINAVNIHTGNYDAEHTTSTAAGIICGFIIEATIKNCTTDETSTATAAHAAGMAVVTFGGKGTAIEGCTNNATITGTVKADGIVANPLYPADTQTDCTNNGEVVEGSN